MDEQPGRSEERDEVVEVEETRTVLRSPAGTARELPSKGKSMTWLWVLLLALVVGALAWYALSRGEPQELEVPNVEAPDLELPAPE